MKHLKIILLFTPILGLYMSQAQENNEYIEFNDRKNIVHGVYLGINGGYGEIKGNETYIIGLKIAYVANRKFEVGLLTKGLFSNTDLPGVFSDNDADFGAVYSGFHLEPIFFSKSKFNLSFPVLIGGGAAGYINTDWVNNEEAERYQEDQWDALFVVEPGVNVLYNLSRYVQLEAGIKYRFSSKVELSPDLINRINGFSSSFGIKVGVFNLGRNRYKKKISNDQ